MKRNEILMILLATIGLCLAIIFFIFNLHLLSILSIFIIYLIVMFKPQIKRKKKNNIDTTSEFNRVEYLNKILKIK